MSSILIADPHILCREALCAYIAHLDQSLSVDGVSAVHLLEERAKAASPDLVIVDADLPGWEKADVSGAKMAVIVRSMKEDMMLNTDLQGIFSRSLSSKAFLKGIQDILAGGTFFSSEAEFGEAEIVSPKIPPHNFNLTAREKEVLSYLVKGQSNKDIARALDLQVVTVKLHVRGICRKMKAANRTQAALTAKENGWA